MQKSMQTVDIFVDMSWLGLKRKYKSETLFHYK